jgi:hypothetical protein
MRINQLNPQQLEDLEDFLSSAVVSSRLDILPRFSKNLAHEQPIY